MGEKVVMLLLQAYPDAAEGKCENGDMPFHAAIKNKASDAVVMSLLKAYPDAAKEKGNKGDMPLHLALKNEASEKVLMAFSRTGSTDCMIPSLLSISLIYGCMPSMAF